MSEVRFIKVCLLGVVVASLSVPAVVSPASSAPGDVGLTFGEDSFGQLGNGTAGAHHAPEQVAALAGADDVAGGREHVLALLAGNVWAWGSDQKGAVGNGTPYENVASPTRVLAGTATNPYVQATTGHYHSLARRQDGSVMAWGWNSRGQMGPNGGTATRQAAPRAVPLPGPAAMVAAGRAHSIALIGGAMYTWGDNTFGQLGLGTADTSRHPTPTRVSGLPAIAFVAGGRDTTYAIATNGDLYAWGNSQYGQVGNGTIGKDAAGNPRVVLARTRITTVTGFRLVEAGADHAVAVTTNGRTFTWGRNGFGQLGYTGGSQSRPRQVTALAGIDEVFSGRDHCIAIAANGTVYLWGRNDGGQLGVNPATVPERAAPAAVPALSGAFDAGAGQVYTVVLR